MFKKANQKGQSLVEVAIAMPLLILILMGILDLGRAYFTYVALADAAAEGAQYAAMNPRDPARITGRTQDSISNGLGVFNPDPDAATVSIDYVDLSSGSPITVTIEYEYQILTPFMNRFVPDGVINMKAAVSQSIINN